MKIDKRRIENANDFFFLSMKILFGWGIIMGVGYLILEVNYWFALLFIPLLWIAGYLFLPNIGEI